MYEFLQYRVADSMVRDPITIAPGASLADAGALFDEHDFNSLPVVEDGKLRGVFTKLDFLRAFVFTTESVMPHYDDIIRQPVEKFVTSEVVAVDPEMPLTRVLQQMVDSRCKSFPVLEAGRLVGIIAREDILSALRRAVAHRLPAGKPERK